MGVTTPWGVWEAPLEPEESAIFEDTAGNQLDVGTKGQELEEAFGRHSPLPTPLRAALLPIRGSKCPLGPPVGLSKHCERFVGPPDG